MLGKYHLSGCNLTLPILLGYADDLQYVHSSLQKIGNIGMNLLKNFRMSLMQLDCILTRKNVNFYLDPNSHEETC